MKPLLFALLIPGLITGALTIQGDLGGIVRSFSTFFGGGLDALNSVNKDVPRYQYEPGRGFVQPSETPQAGIDGSFTPSDRIIRQVGQ